jgi:hypothetical protein
VAHGEKHVGNRQLRIDLVEYGANIAEKSLATFESRANG